MRHLLCRKRIFKGDDEAPIESTKDGGGSGRTTPQREKRESENEPRRETDGTVAKEKGHKVRFEEDKGTKEVLEKRQIKWQPVMQHSQSVAHRLRRNDPALKRMRVFDK